MENRIRDLEATYDSIKTALSILTAKIATDRHFDVDRHLLKQLEMADLIEKNFEKIFSAIQPSGKKTDRRDTD